MVLFAIAATGSGMDRIIAETPSVSPAAGGVPALFADASLRRAAAIELAAGRFPAAAQLARRATIRSPLEPASTALLGAAWLGEGRIAAADSAFRVSGQLGWRDTVTQTYWMQVALLGGDYAVAAQRLDAMLRREPAQAGRPELLAPFESSAAGRAMLVGRLAQRPGWLPVYFNPTGVLGPAQLAQRAQVAALLSKDTPLGCGGISPLVRRLITEDAVTPAHDLWQQHCAPARGAIISDPDLTGGLGNDPSPFGWQKHSDGSIRLRSAGRGGGLVLENTAPFTRNFARQMLVLPSGSYRLSWRAVGADGRVSNRIEALSACSAQGALPLAARRASDTRMSGVLRITGACEGQFLIFRITPGAGELEFGSIRLDPMER
ncbi:hypothetical protein [Allopontixanthobacter sp.]|uniref:hypothetical protein n=1 Tax=Allopontixanthobacter sp. TaxID=2906452 RepID=UPI002AB8B62F|nr:hypothetical protein [Allopontixanthobacter sp.]MDZ4307493.1 hypothetical protein [Allopontixanthobacter sp.]